MVLYLYVNLFVSVAVVDYTVSGKLNATFLFEKLRTTYHAL